MASRFEGLVVSWTIGTSPTAELVTTMPDPAVSTIGDGERPVVDSDRGCTLENAACEGFFGWLKNAMFYHRDWSGTTIEGLIDELDRYIRWYNDERIKMSLGAMSPVECPKRLGLVA